MYLQGLGAQADWMSPTFVFLFLFPKTDVALVPVRHPFCCWRSVVGVHHHPLTNLEPTNRE